MAVITPTGTPAIDMIIRYKPGAGGGLMWAQLNQWPADGLNIVGINLPHMVFQPLEGQVQYKTDDIVPVYWYHYTPDALVVLESSPRVPWVHGAELPDDIRPTLVVHTDREPLTLDARTDGNDPVEAAIAQHVASLVPDGATLELGIGSLPERVLQALRGHRDLGIHSAVIGDGVVELIEAASASMRNRGKTIYLKGGEVQS